MIRKAAAILAVSTLAVLAVACGAAPDGTSFDNVGSTSQAITFDPNYCVNSVVPFTTPSIQTVYVPGTPADPEEGIMKATKGYKTTELVCTLIASPPVAAPPGGYVPGELSSCSMATALAPPATTAFSGCTAGYTWPSQDDNGFPVQASAFLCPTADDVPNSTTTFVGIDPQGHYIYTVTNYFAVTHPTNGCFGQSTVSTYQYIVSTSYSESVIPGHNPPVHGGGTCGAACI